MKIYDILLNTPLGKKEGELRTTVQDGKLTGFLSLFGNTEPIHGTVDENGLCFLRGRFITLLSTVNFTADGWLGAQVLQLHLRGEKNLYEMSGALRAEKGEYR